MSKTLAVIVGLLLLAALLAFSMTYTVNFHEVAIRTRFGHTNPDSIIKTAGLKFRLPLFVDKVTRYDTRLQLRESPLELVQTADGQQLQVKAFMTWQVDTKNDGPLKFFRSFPTVEEANQSLADQFSTALRTGLSRYKFDDLIGSKSRLVDAEAAIKAEMLTVSAKGIDPVSVGISQLILPPRTTQAVLARMQATRTKISESERIKGGATATAIESLAKAQAEKIRNFAKLRASELQQRGDSEVSTTLGEMDKERELAIFLSHLDALRASLSQYVTLVIPTTVAPFHLLQMDTPQDSHGIPQPTANRSVPAPKVKMAGDSPGQSAADDQPIDSGEKKGS